MNELTKAGTELIKKGGLKDLPKLTKNFLSVRAPELAIGTGAVGLLVAGVLAVKATVKAVRIADKDTEDRKLRVDDGENIDVSRTKVETVKLVWKCYIPASITAGVSIGALVFGVKKELGRSAALATALTMAEESAEKYKKIVEENVPEKKRDEIKKKYAQSQVDDALKFIDENAPEQNIRKTGDGQALFYFPSAGLFVRTSMVNVYQAANEVNRQLSYGENITLDEYFEALNVDYIPEFLNLLTAEGSRGVIEVTAEDALVTYNGEPCTVVDLKQSGRDVVAILATKLQ